MATASVNVSIKAMQEDLSCSICFDLLQEPKSLDCQHVYCLQCLKNWVRTDTVINCPECRHTSIVPPGGLPNIPTNLRLKNLADKYAAHVDEQKSAPMCQNHEGERQHFFCVTCGVTVCRDCLVLNHDRPQHKIEELKVITKTQKAHMKTHLDTVKDRVERLQEDEKTLNELKRKVQAAQIIAESDVDKHVQKRIAETKAKGKKTKERIQAISHQYLETLQQEKNRIEDSGKRLRNVSAAVKKCIDTAADHIYMSQHDSLAAKIENLCIAQHGTPISDMACLHFCPESDPVNLGKVTENCHVKRNWTLVSRIGSESMLFDIAATQTGLLAVCTYKDVIVYRDCNGDYKRQFSMDSSNEDPEGNLTRPLAIAVTSENKFLVFDDASSVKVFSSTGKYESSLAIQGDIITITPADVIVIGNNKKETITVYQPNGTLLRTLQVGGGITEIASNDKQIAFTKFDKNILCVIDFESGQELWRQDLECPYGICYDGNTSSILVTRYKDAKDFIEQYCSTTGQLVSRLASGLCYPQAITMTYDGKVAVANLLHVKVYSNQ